MPPLGVPSGLSHTWIARRMALELGLCDFVGCEAESRVAVMVASFFHSFNLVFPVTQFMELCEVSFICNIDLNFFFLMDKFC